MKILKILVDEVPETCGACNLFHTLKETEDGKWTGYCYPIVQSIKLNLNMDDHEMNGNALYKRNDCPLQIKMCN